MIVSQIVVTPAKAGAQWFKFFEKTGFRLSPE
jgi:hypothetical protein